MTSYVLYVCPFCREQVSDDWWPGHSHVGLFIEPLELPVTDKGVDLGSVEVERARNITRWEQARLDFHWTVAERVIRGRRYKEHFDSLTAKEQKEEFGYTASDSPTEAMNGILKKVWPEDALEEQLNARPFFP